MPIYAYRCEACGHSKDVLQKVSDARLTTCPQCGAQAFQKQVTSAGFQLKGSGWYVTDFKGGGQKPAGDSKSDAAATSGTPGAGSEAKGDQGGAGKSADAGAPSSDAKSNKSTETPAGKTPSTTPSTTPVAKAPSSAGTGGTPP